MPKFTLQKIKEVDRDEWLRQGLSIAEYNALLAAEKNKHPIRIDCCAVDAEVAEDAYYDITLPNGMTFHAVQGFHIKGLDQWVKPFTQGAQYLIELKFGGCTDPSVIKHDAIEKVIRYAVQRELDRLQKNPHTGEQHPLIMETKVGLVVFETDYRVDD